MDLSLYGRVFWRFRVLVAAGVLLATMLAFLTFVRVDLAKSPHLRYREHESWSSQATLWVTQRGFPSGRSALPITGATGVQGAATTTPSGSAVSGAGKQPAFADPARFTDLAVLYSKLVPTDLVLSFVRRSGPINGTIAAEPGFDSISGDILPLVLITATASTPKDAEALVRRATSGLQAYIDSRQASNGIASGDRVIVTRAQAATTPVLAKGRSMTKPVVVFLATLLAVLGLTAVLENVRPKIRSVEGSAAKDSAPEAAA
jgi:hypothetical protein